MRQRLIILLLSVYFGIPSNAQSEQERDLKAAFIYNFTRYIDWDSASLRENFVIGILGQSSLIEPLSEIAKTNTAKSRRIVIRRFNRPDDIRDCHILFIPRGSPFNLAGVLERVSKGMLTISEEPGYAERGTALNFVIRNDKLKFEANLKAIYSAGLTAGSQLLKLAIIVN